MPGRTWKRAVCQPLVEVALSFARERAKTTIPCAKRQTQSNIAGEKEMARRCYQHRRAGNGALLP